MGKSSPKFVESVGAGEAATGIPAAVLQRLKDTACPAWRGGRLYIEELEAWMDDNELPEVPQSAQEEWNLKIAEERHRKLKLANDIEEKKVVPIEDAAGLIHKMAIHARETLRRALEEELPPLVAGKPVDEIRPIMRDTVDRICEQMQKDGRNL